MRVRSARGNWKGRRRAATLGPLVSWVRLCVRPALPSADGTAPVGLPGTGVPRPIHRRAEENKGPPSPPVKEFSSQMGSQLDPGSSSLRASGLHPRAQLSDSEPVRLHSE